MAGSGHRGSVEASGSTSSSLLQRLKAHDADAWNTLVQLYGPMVYRWCRDCGLQAEDVADVGQEVFGAVAASIEGFHRERPGGSFRGWLWTIARNKIRDHFRRLRGEAQARGGTDGQAWLAQLPADAPEPMAADARPAYHDSLENRAVEQVRAEAEERTWQAFWVAAVEGRPAAEVADQLGMSIQAVYDAKYRVRRKIRQQFGDLLG